MLPRLISILVSTLLLAGLGVLILKGVTPLDSRAVMATHELVKAGAARIELELQQQGRDLATLAERFAAEQGFATDLKALTAVLALSPASGKVPDRLKSRIDSLNAKLQEQVAVLKEEKQHLTAVTVVDENGLVLVTDSTVFKIGDRLAVPKEEAGDGTAVDGGGGEGTDQEAAKTAPKPKAAAGKGGFVLTALDDEVQQVTMIDGGNVKWVGAAPIKLRGTIVGAVVMEQSLHNLPHAAGTEAMLIIGDTVVVGKPPKGFDVAAVKDSDQSYVLIQRNAPALVPGLGELPFGPMFVDRAAIGVWVQRFPIPGAATAKGLAFADVAPLYGELAGFQALVVLLLFGVWLGHVIILLLAGAALHRGIDRIADFLGRLNRGTGEERQLSEKGVPKPLVRLVVLLNKTLERTAGGAPVAPIAKAPSLDDVLRAHAREASDGADLEFRGITGSGSIEAAAAESAAMSAPDADGFESMRDVAQAVAQEADFEASADSHPEQLPEAPEASDAINAIDDQTRSAPPPPPAAESLQAEPEPEPAPAVEPPPPDRALAVSAAVSAVLTDADFGFVSQTPAPAPAPASVPPPEPSAARGKTPTKAGRVGAAPLGDLLDEYASDATMVMELSPQLMAVVRDATSDAGKRRQAADNVSSDAALADAAVADVESPGPSSTPPSPAKKPAPPVRPQAAALSPAVTAGVVADNQTASVVSPAVAKQMAAKPASSEHRSSPHFREIFDQFVETRKKCGEGTTDLTFDKFVAKLEKSKEAVIAKHQCADVRFQVYVKDGKAALKALPAR
jgi:hypothetical protein